MQNDLTKGSVFKTIVRFSLPYFAAYFLQTFYGLADLLITGQFCGAETITAVANGSQVLHFVTVVVVGLSVGTTVMIAHEVGRRASRNTIKTSSAHHGASSGHTQTDKTPTNTYMQIHLDDTPSKRDNDKKIK